MLLLQIGNLNLDQYNALKPTTSVCSGKGLLKHTRQINTRDTKCTSHVWLISSSGTTQAGGLLRKPSSNALLHNQQPDDPMATC